MVPVKICKRQFNLASTIFVMKTAIGAQILILEIIRKGVDRDGGFRRGRVHGNAAARRGISNVACEGGLLGERMKLRIEKRGRV